MSRLPSRVPHDHSLQPARPASRHLARDVPGELLMEERTHYANRTELHQPVVLFIG